MKHKFLKLSVITSLILSLCACTPAIDNGIIRSTDEHLTLPDITQPESETIPESETSDEPPISADNFDPSANPVTGFDEAILTQAQDMLASMTLEQKVGQMFLARCPETDTAAQAAAYDLGGYVLFARDFENKTQEQVIADISGYQEASAIPMFIAVDEEGGTVNRVSLNPQLRPYPFWSPQELYAEGGMELIRSDAEDKSLLLKNLGINLNLAPVCDVSTDPNDFINARAFGLPAPETSEYVSTVVRTMNENGMGSALKHFPGYGNNTDTHTGISVDTRGYEDFASSDFAPFAAGIKENATAVLVSHNIVEAFDNTRPASLAPAVHDVLRNTLGFDGIILTDDLSMEAITQYTSGAEAAVAAILAGNDMLCCTDFTTQIPAVIAAVSDGTISEARIDQSVLRILASKIELGIIS